MFAVQPAVRGREDPPMLTNRTTTTTKRPSHIKSTEERGGTQEWETPLVTNLKCLTVKFCAWKNERPACFLSFQVSCITKRAQMTSKHSSWVLWNFISSTTFYAKHCGLSQPVAQRWLWFSGTHRINSTPHSLWGELKASLSPTGFGWVWLNSAVVVSSWARKWHYVLRKTTINCQGQ